VIESLCKARKTVVVEATRTAIEMGAPKAFNVIVLGAAARYVGFRREDWLQVIEATVPPKTMEVNRKAFEAGYSMEEA
jgi:indolepyruvate ferredoxin oxidoreductase beta subunit